MIATVQCCNGFLNTQCEPLFQSLPISIYIFLVHLAHEAVDGSITVAVVTTLGEGDAFLAVAASGRAELEWPEEVGGHLEVRADSVDLVDEILHTDDAILAE